MALRRWRLPVLLAVTLLGFSLMTGLEKAGAGPCEYSSQLQLQFAWSAERVDAIPADWGAAGRERVRLGIYADFLYLAGYASLMAALVGRVAAPRATGSPAWLSLGRPLAQAQWLAGALDAVENLLLLGILNDALNPAPAMWISLMAAVKFALVLAGVVYLMAAVTAWFNSAE